MQLLKSYGNRQFARSTECIQLVCPLGPQRLVKDHAYVVRNCLRWHLRGYSASLSARIPVFCLRASLRGLAHLRVLLTCRSYDHLPSYNMFTAWLQWPCGWRWVKASVCFLKVSICQICYTPRAGKICWSSSKGSHDQPTSTPTTPQQQVHKRM